jgi:hypothetical protein
LTPARWAVPSVAAQPETIDVRYFSELVEEYLRGALGRLETSAARNEGSPRTGDEALPKIPTRTLLWNGAIGDNLPEDSGRVRPKFGSKAETKKQKSLL